MKKEELFKLPVGSEIHLTDGICYYVLTTHKVKTSRLHVLKEKRCPYGGQFVFHEEFVRDPDTGERYKDVIINFSMGGLYAGCGNYVGWLRELKPYTP